MADGVRGGVGGVSFDRDSWRFDCEPSLTDTQMVEFCREGFLLLPGVIPDEVNARARDWLDGSIAPEPAWVPAGMTDEDLARIRASHEPSTIFLEEWFYRGVLLDPTVAGIMRSLLGRTVGLPVLASLHRVDCPEEAGGWHYDFDSVFGPELRFVEVFYFPQDTPPELGPTEVLPASPFERRRVDDESATVATAGPAGTIGIHHQSILHRRGPSTASGPRRMLKYSYWRTTAPSRNWVREPDFDLPRADFGGHGAAMYAAHIYKWLCGEGDDYRVIGSQAWPAITTNQVGAPYGFGLQRGYLPDWRKDNGDGYALPTSDRRRP